MWVHKNTLEIQIKTKLSQRSYQTHWSEKYTTLSKRPHQWRLQRGKGNVSPDLSSIHPINMVLKIIRRKVTIVSGPSTDLSHGCGLLKMLYGRLTIWLIDLEFRNPICSFGPMVFFYSQPLPKTCPLLLHLCCLSAP